MERTTPFSVGDPQPIATHTHMPTHISGLTNTFAPRRAGGHRLLFHSWTPTATCAPSLGLPASPPAPATRTTYALPPNPQPWGLGFQAVRAVVGTGAAVGVCTGGGSRGGRLPGTRDTRAEGLDNLIRFDSIRFSSLCPVHSAGESRVPQEAPGVDVCPPLPLLAVSSGGTPN